MYDLIVNCGPLKLLLCTIHSLLLLLLSFLPQAQAYVCVCVNANMQKLNTQKIQVKRHTVSLSATKWQVIAIWCNTKQRAAKKETKPVEFRPTCNRWPRTYHCRLQGYRVCLHCGLQPCCCHGSLRKAAWKLHERIMELLPWIGFVNMEIRL